MSDKTGLREDRVEGTRSRAVGSLLFAAVGLVVFVYVFLETASFSPEARPFPRFIAVVGGLAAAFALSQSYLAARRAPSRTDTGADTASDQSRRDLLISYVGPPLYGAMLLAFGFWIASAVFLVGLLVALGERRPALVAAITLGTLGTIYLVFELGFSIRLPGSLLLQMLSA